MTESYASSTSSSPQLRGQDLIVDALLRGAPTYAAAVATAEAEVGELGRDVRYDAVMRDLARARREAPARFGTGEWDGGN